MKMLKTQNLPRAQIIAETVKVLRAGGLVIFPTETTYGAGVLATNQAAVDKLLRFKARREGKPLSIAVTDIEMARKYVEVNESAKKVYARFLPGPVTVVSKSLGKTAKGVESEFGTLGVRIPAYELVIELVRALGEPITATSGNGSGAKRPYSIQDVKDGLSAKQAAEIDLILDAGTLPTNPSSTVIDTTLSTPVVFRQGEIKIGDAGSTDTTTLIAHSEAETQTIAQRLLLKHWNDVTANGLVFGLNGSLGAGKTALTKGLAKYLGISATITSPTYSYVETYPFTYHGVTGQLAHFDVWKVESAAEMDRLGFAEHLGPRKIVVIEWVSSMGEYVKKAVDEKNIPYIEITITDTAKSENGEADHERQLEIKEKEA